MIVVTGGAGFIGSVFAARLNQRGCDDILIVDHLGSSSKWKNVAGVRFREYLDRTEFIARLENGSFDDQLSHIVHLGACSRTTESDADFLIMNNYRYTQRLAQWWSNHQLVRFMYASSAATYGDGRQGYRDDEHSLQALRPLNMYGFSKHLFDLYAARQGWLEGAVGLKFFNVFGPNEYHKGEMQSVIAKAHPSLRAGAPMRLFKSHRPGIADGEQRRDFIYVKDAVEIMLFFLDNPSIGGIYNVGTGCARSWNDLAAAIFSAMGRDPSIEYVPMPEELRDRYQYFTEADTGKLRGVGCSHVCMTLESSVRDYVCSYLNAATTYAWGR